MYLITKISICKRSLKVILFFFLFSQQVGYAQNKIWESLALEPTVVGQRFIIPEKYKVFKLNVNALKTSLSKAPLENSASARLAAISLEIPMPDGKIEPFFIVESPIMEEGLAAKFPEIKTYAGYSINNPSISGRFDFTSSGFHGMIFSTEGIFFIDPYSRGNIEHYIAYDKRDYTSKKAFSCSFDPQIHSVNIDTPTNPKQNRILSPNITNTQIGDGVLRNYRLALAATGEYTAFHGGTVALALAAQVTTMNRVNGVFLRDFAVKMNIVANNNLVVYTNAATDPYTNDDGGTMLSENINNLNSVIGSANYDIGHVFSTGGGGVAYLGVPCSSFKGGGVTGSGAPIGDAFDIDYVAHEMGHQFGGNHTQNNNCNRNSTTAFEPGSGYSIMGYAGICSPNVQNNSDAHFHGGSLSEMLTFITGSGNSCATKPAYTNAKPTINSNTASQTIPKSTPFMLSGLATDPDGNASLTYCWDQMDTQVATQPPVGTATGGPSFRGFSPVSSGTRYFPKLSDLVANVSPTWEVLPTVARTLNFRLVVRDNATGGGTNDRVDIVLTVDGTAGPFVVNSPNTTGISYTGFSTQTVTWAVASTDIAPISCTNVDILLSTDGGLTYPTTLASNVPNNGSASVTMPNINTTTARIMVKGTGKAFFDISNNNFSITPCTAPNSPTGVSVSSTNICSGTAITLNATCATGTVSWYSDLAGSDLLGTGTGFSQSPIANKTYYAACVALNCPSSRVATNQVNVTTQPSIPTNVSVSSTSICSGTAVSLNATCTVGTVTWYNSSTAVSALGTGTGFLQSPASNITYYSACENGSCKSTRVATNQVNVTTQPTTPTNVAVNASSICPGTAVTLTANCSVGTVTWYNSATGNTVLGTGTGFSNSPASATTYYSSCENGSCKSTRIATSQVILAPTSSTLTSNFSSGTNAIQTIQTIIATNKIISPAKTTYKAGNSISLNNGFEAQNGSVFLAQIQGCSN
ncbi:hypothetical protein Emtol_3468 [Emticicia oligotrophica DSM 17448]|uniref:Peptidase M12B domain-containing protein n=1 Tax=Emticicia oligotrophica (strain DSM 17448 / CIP 109782 / MTCC 6937 / GPTSA100-15) TaxID=929562 RepID=A0ABN4ASE8_EMTOG|nr:zinc-dependent metalloprotease family protein [Emticicia oligotrophica]AFK04596.1 hypothetical protein Emtol_3468 [Emticicia oligotrophica DSM 17448]